MPKIWTYERDEDDNKQGIPGGVGLKLGIIRKFASINSLCLLHTLVEANISNADPEPGYKTCNSCQIHQIRKPGEKSARTLLDTHVHVLVTKQCKKWTE